MLPEELPELLLLAVVAAALLVVDTFVVVALTVVDDDLTTWVVETAVVETAGGVVDATRVEDDVRALQRFVLARFLFATESCPRNAWRATWPCESADRAVTGLGPNEHARIARDERATRLRSLADIVS